VNGRFGSGMTPGGWLFFVMVIATLVALYFPHSMPGGMGGVAIFAIAVALLAIAVLAVIYPRRTENREETALRVEHRRARLKKRLRKRPRSRTNAEPEYREQIERPFRTKWLPRLVVTCMGAAWSLTFVTVAWYHSRPTESRAETAWFALMLAFLPVLIWLDAAPDSRARARRGRRWWRLEQRHTGRESRDG